MRNSLLVWGQSVLNLVSKRLQLTGFYTKRAFRVVGRPAGFSGFTSSSPAFSQTLSPSIFRTTQVLLTTFYPFSTLPNNNKSLINLFTYY